MPENSVYECFGWGPEGFAESCGDDRHPPTFLPPVSSSGSWRWWWNMTISAELITLGASRQTQPKVQHIVATFIDNTSRVIQSAIKNLTTLNTDDFYGS